MGRLGWLGRLMGERPDEAAALYAEVVAHARRPDWYVEGAVPDTVDGRFDMIAAVLATVMLRLEGDPDAAAPSAHLAERFVEDMDGQLREAGIGDVVVGKHIGKMMAMLGGRLGAYRDAFAAGDLRPALVRNLYRGANTPDEAVAHVADALTKLRDELASLPLDALLAGRLA